MIAAIQNDREWLDLTRLQSQFHLKVLMLIKTLPIIQLQELCQPSSLLVFS